MGRREARRLVRQFWATWMEHQDMPDHLPAEIGPMWGEETRRIAKMIARSQSTPDILRSEK